MSDDADEIPRPCTGCGVPIPRTRKRGRPQQRCDACIARRTREQDAKRSREKYRRECEPEPVRIFSMAMNPEALWARLDRDGVRVGDNFEDLQAAWRARNLDWLAK